MNKLMNRAGLLAAAFALALAVALALNAATQTTEVAEAQTPIGTDTDGDGLIEIKNYDQLYAMRYDMDGDGVPNYDLNNDGIRDDGIPPNAYSTHLSCPAASTCNGYELGGNISLAGHGDWVPSGLHTVFNGNGFTITGLEGEGGLFSSIGGNGVVKNVNVLKASITIDKDTAVVTSGVLSAANDGTIIGSYASGDVTVQQDVKDVGSIGGLVGRNQGTIAASVVDVDITVHGIPNVDQGWQMRVGGFVGINKGLIHGAYAYGNVTDARTAKYIHDTFPTVSDLRAVGFNARGFTVNHANHGGEIHWSFSYGARIVERDRTRNQTPARFAYAGPSPLVTNSCALPDESQFTCPTSTPTPTPTPTSTPTPTN